MPGRIRKLTIEDSVDSPPFSLIDDLVVVVRTPRSDDFVTVEIGRACDCLLAESAFCGGRCLSVSKPAPWVTGGWCSEVSVGETVAFEIARCPFRLTLERIDHSHCQPPWVCCEFYLEADVPPSGLDRLG